MVYQVGEFKLKTILAGTFRLDGGAMFGSVPRILWERKLAADDQNRIPLATRLLWIEKDGNWTSADGRDVQGVLIDAGNGEKFDDRSKEMFEIQVSPPKEWGVPLDRVSDLIITHLHFDHGGGLTQRNDSGELELTFPQAVHYVQKDHWDYANQPWPREQASFISENIKPLQNATLVQLEGETEILPGIQAELAFGHTESLQWLLVGQGVGAVAFPSDLIPTSKHLHLPWIMGYDRCAQTTYSEKEAFLNRAVDEAWVVVFEHDPEIPAATLQRDTRGRFDIKEVVDF